jgi:hypothetical protein
MIELGKTKVFPVKTRGLKLTGTIGAGSIMLASVFTNSDLNDQPSPITTIDGQLRVIGHLAFA